jgi:hypothetical protein
MQIEHLWSIAVVLLRELHKREKAVRGGISQYVSCCVYTVPRGMRMLRVRSCIPAARLLDTDHATT